MAKVRALAVQDGLTHWDFQPSVGIIAARVDKLGLDIRSFREPLKRSIQQVLAPSFQKNFTSGGRPDKWPGLAEYTLKRHEKEGGSGKPLMKSKKLYKTMGQLNIWDLKSQSASLQSLPAKVRYGGIHQAGFGSNKLSGFDPQAIMDSLMDNGPASASRSIPQRQFVMIQDEDYDGIEKVFSDWLDERIARNWTAGV